MRFIFIFTLFCSSLLAEKKPNVVILLSDDLGFKDIGCYDGPVKTPNLDSLAAAGTKFSDFYSGCAVCSPSRATLLTGRHHIRTGVYSWIFNKTQKSHLLERETTIAELLKGQGYSTAHIGKWHLGLPTETMDKPTPVDHGFDYWFATDNNAMPSHKNPNNFIRNGKEVGELEGYSCELVVNEAITWLDQHRNPEAPFFLNIWFHEPHAPIASPKEISDLYSGEKKAQVYSGTIDNTDRQIGRLLKKLKSIGPVEDTIIIYASDNGSYRQDRVGELRGRKGSNWDGGLRVPGIFYWPGKISAGKTIKTPAGLVDVLPTLCDLLDIEVSHKRPIDGSSIKALLTGGEKAFSRHQPLFWHLQKSRPIVAIRDGKYSLVAEPDYEISKSNMFKEEWIPLIKNGGYKNYQLFNLDEDPSQKQNLAQQYPELLTKLKKKLLSINASVMAEGPDWHLE
jgi:arylsulfatase A